MSIEPKCQLYAILARRSPRAVIFRRGPSKLVRLIAWDRKRDTFEPGQWLKGRIYERRCDLSPSGDRLIYFASDGVKTWTAISNPPYLTALSLWWGMGAWGGGGHFESDHDVLINHTPLHMEPDESVGTPKIRYRRGAELGGGGGEDDPIGHVRMVRDGWTLTAEGKHDGYTYDGPARWVYAEPRVYEKSNGRRGRGERILRQNLRAVAETQGDWYALDYEIGDRSLGRCHWADFDDGGDLLWSQAGKLYRTPYPYEDDRELADFSEQTFEPVPPPDWARRW